MIFDRLRDHLHRRTSAVPDGRLCCYGKLPFDREFLRFHLDSDAGRWLTPWIDGAHHAVAASGTATLREDVELRGIFARDGGKRVLTTLLRPSRDGGGRSYPVCVFAVHDARAMQNAWHLAPLWANSFWPTVAGTVLNGSLDDRTALSAALDNTACRFDDAAVLGQRFDAATQKERPAPWEKLTGVASEDARHLAVALVQLGSAQRHARSIADGIAARITLPDADDSDLDGTTRLAVWIRLFNSVAAARSAWPAIIEVWQREAARPESVCIFGREPTAADLAYLLAGTGEPPIDDLSDRWETEPSSEWGQHALAAVLDERAASLADLWGGIP
jgi:type VI secretion system ImpM family protein